ncbi:MAG: OmpH family outer membrane protein [Alphaproteobacteria bacterium]
MRVFQIKLGLIFALFIMVVATTPAFAQVNIAVVDVDLILAESKAAKSIKSQVAKKRKSFISEVKKTEDKLRADQKAIESKRSELSKEQLIEKIKGFEKKRMEAGKGIQSQKSKLDSAYTKAMNKLTKSIYDVCQEIANERKIDLVITRQNIIVGSMSLDITKDVMERMNKGLPKLNLEVK